MRYVIRRANALDLAGITAVARTHPADRGERLLAVCELSSQVWLAASPDGVPDALFGVAPVPDEPETGQFWMFVVNALADSERDRRDVLRLVVDEMLNDFTRLENSVDERKKGMLDMMKSAGFTIEPATARGSGVSCHYVWLESQGSGVSPLIS